MIYNLTYLNQWRSKGGEVGRASLCVAYNFLVSISLITLKNI